MKTFFPYRQTLCSSFLIAALFAFPAASQQTKPAAQQSLPIVEQGKFTLHKFEQPIGEETYKMTRDGDSLAVTVDFKFTDRGTDVPLTVNFRGAQDLTPQTFAIKGKTARGVSIDQEVDVQHTGVRLRTRDKWSDLALPSQPFFTIAGYAPATMQMLMVRYWASHGSPAELATLPGAKVKIEPRGTDTIRDWWKRREARTLHHRGPDLGARDAVVRQQPESCRRGEYGRGVRSLRSDSGRL